ncbi:hypothetical protein [Streptomyces sp. CB03911]|uniref:hypothetical protein n=1 Tax=Streptomyces sp. CB03911 TaxID=1804758 RepID=UPI00093AF601|nr:hypothetical protein [Streptomyces sp. CB03911]
MTAARTEGRLLPKPRERTVVTPEVRRLLAFWGGNIAAVHRELIAQAAVVFAGGDGCAKVLRREPMLASRVYIWQHAVPLTLTEILATIPAFHPLWEGVDPDLIALVDKQAAHGNFRAWARITQHAAAAGLAAQDRTHIDEHRLRRALAAGGGVELPPAEGVAVVPATPLAGRRAGRTAGPAGQSLARGAPGQLYGLMPSAVWCRWRTASFQPSPSRYEPVRPVGSCGTAASCSAACLQASATSARIRSNSTTKASGQCG